MGKTLNDMYEDGLDELLLLHNPLGGRPRKAGAYVHVDDDGRTTYDVSTVKEDVAHRYMLGYCYCGRKVLIGPKRAEVLAAAFAKWDVKARIPRPERLAFRVRVARLMVKGLQGT